MQRQENTRVIEAQMKLLEEMIGRLHQYMRQIHHDTEAIKHVNEALNLLVGAEIELEKIKDNDRP